VSGANDTYLASAEIYDPDSNAWSSAASMAHARDYHTATLLQDGRVLVAAGFDGDYVATAEVYDPVANTWSPAGSLATARRIYTATRLGDGRVLVAGGGSATGYEATTEIYTPATNTWSPAHAMAHARSGHGATLLSGGDVLVEGGVNTTEGTLNSSASYNPASDTWTDAGFMATPRVRHAAVALPDGSVLVIGGSAAAYLAAAEVWDPDADRDGVPDRFEIAPGCGGPVPAPSLRSQMTLPCNPDTDADGFLDRPANGIAHAHANTDAAMDNCPAAANPTQSNSDGNFIALAGRTFDDLTRPMSDWMGDACDIDADNDGLDNVDEASLAVAACPSATGPTGALAPDSDGDRVLDGAECLLGTDPASALSRPPAFPPGDSDGDGLSDAAEALIGSDPHVIDTDGDGVRDSLEFLYYGTNTRSANSDGDRCSDGKEAASVNADTAVNALDLMTVAQAFGPGDAPPYLPDLDADKSGAINALDLQFVARQFGPC
jgi:hypothetical protein